MTSKLEVYNDALSNIGERPLLTLSEARDPRRKLDAQWDRGVSYCLGRGLWNFAMRAVVIDASDIVDPTFGYDNAFEKQSDWIRTAVLSSSETFDPPLLDYSDENGYWYANCNPLYAQFVSSDGDYGGDLSQWPESFAEYVGIYLARKICMGISSAESRLEALIKLEKRALATARSEDAMNQAPGFPPTGTWARSRVGSLTFPARNNRR